MKKFKFALDTVLSYKQQVLDALEGEHAAAMAKVHEQEKVLDAVWQEYRDCNAEYREKKAAGLSITEAMIYESSLRSGELHIQRETNKLEKLQEEAEKKREEMVAAKIDTSSLEKLKDKKLEQYRKDEQKDQELLVDEFISSTRAAGASA